MSFKNKSENRAEEQKITLYFNKIERKQKKKNRREKGKMITKQNDDGK